MRDNSNGIINLTRGDTLVLPIEVNLGTRLNPNIITLEGNTKLYFGLMAPNQAFEDAIVKKVLDSNSPTDENGNPLLMLSSEDTEHLLVGKYYYTLKCRYINEWGQEAVKTIKPSTLFWIMGENPSGEPTITTIKDSLPEDNIINNEITKYETIIFEGGEIT